MGAKPEISGRCVSNHPSIPYRLPPLTVCTFVDPQVPRRVPTSRNTMRGSRPVHGYLQLIDDIHVSNITQ